MSNKRNINKMCRRELRATDLKDAYGSRHAFQKDNKKKISLLTATWLAVILTDVVIHIILNDSL